MPNFSTGFTRSILLERCDTAIITEKDIAAFISCVNEAKRVEPLQPNGESQQEIWTRIHETICIPDGRPAGDMRALGRTLFRRAQFEPELDLYVAPARHFMHGTSNGEKLGDFSEVDKWREVIRYLDLLQKLPGHKFDPSSTSGMERELAVTGAIARLKGEGYRFAAKDERINFEEGELSVYSQAKLNAVARRLNERPRKTLDYETPAQRFLHSVALTG